MTTQRVGVHDRTETETALRLAGGADNCYREFEREREQPGRRAGGREGRRARGQDGGANWTGRAKAILPFHSF
jgi:hypothetical protein